VIGHLSPDRIGQAHTVISYQLRQELGDMQDFGLGRPRILRILGTESSQARPGQDDDRLDLHIVEHIHQMVCCVRKDVSVSCPVSWQPAARFILSQDAEIHLCLLQKDGALSGYFCGSRVASHATRE
jgi:hypothetical protein